MIKQLALAALVTAGAGAAHAASPWPAKVVGTWNGGANEDSVTITVFNQTGTGDCRQITGKFVDNTTGGTSKILGVYCPATGRIAFRRTYGSSTMAFQNYTASLSVQGDEIYMAGVFAENATAEFVGEYAFYAAK